MFLGGESLGDAAGEGRGCGFGVVAEVWAPEPVPPDVVAGVLAPVPPPEPVGTGPGEVPEFPPEGPMLPMLRISSTWPSAKRRLPRFWCRVLSNCKWMVAFGPLFVSIRIEVTFQSPLRNWIELPSDARGLTQ